MKSDKEEKRMDWYLDLWTKQPMKASVLMEILLLLIVAGILTCFILIRWRRKCKEEKAPCYSQKACLISENPF